MVVKIINNVTELRNFVVGRVGIENLFTAKEVRKLSGWKIMDCYNRILRVKHDIRQQGMFLRNARLWVDKEGNYYNRRPKGLKTDRYSGYYVVRLNKAFDLVPPENTDFDFVIRHLKQFMDVWINIEWESLTKEEQNQLEDMRVEIAKAIVGGGRKHEA